MTAPIPTRAKRRRVAKRGSEPPTASWEVIQSAPATHPPDARKPPRSSILKKLANRQSVASANPAAQNRHTPYIPVMPHNNGPGFRPVSGFAEAPASFRGMTGAEMTAFVPHRPERPEKTEGGKRFKLVSDYQPAGDQPQAIAELVEG